MLNKPLTFDFPFIQKDKNGHVVAPTLIDYLDANIWETAIVLDPTAYPSGSLTIIAPSLGSLWFANDASWGRLPATAPQKMVIDTSMLAAERRRGAALPRKMPLLASIVFDTASVVFTAFNPRSYLKNHQGKHGQHKPTAAATLATLQGDATQSIGVTGGDVLCACGPINAQNNPQPILVRCFLDDGSSVPLSWIYTSMNGQLLTKDANNLLAQLKPQYRAPGGATNANPFWRSCFVKSGANDALPIYSGETYRISAMLGAAPDATQDVTVLLGGTAQRAVLPIIDQHIVVSVADANKAAISVGLDGSTAPAAATVTLQGGGTDPTILTGLPAQTIALKSPAGPQAIVSPGTATLDVTGAASVVAGLTATVAATATTVTDTGGGTFKVQIELIGPTTHVDFEGTDGAVASLDIYQVDIVVAGAAPDLALGRHDAAADTIDSLDLTATLSAPPDLLTPTSTAAWSARIDSSAPLREGLRNDETGEYGTTHWIDFALAAPAGDPQPAANSWTLPPLQLDVDSVVSDTTGDNSKQQSDVLALNAPAPYPGNAPASAGPVLGDATLSVTLKTTADADPVIVTKTLRVKGYDPFAISWSTFLAALQADIQSSFREMKNDSFTDRYFPALTLTLDDLVALCLALFIGESNIAQFSNTKKVANPVPQIPLHALGSRMINFGQPGGVGISQYDAAAGDPPDRIATSFDWRANIAAGVRILHGKFASAINFRAIEKGRLLRILVTLPGYTSAMSKETRKRLDNALDNIVKVTSPTMFGQIAQDDEMALRCRIKLYNGLIPYRSNFGWQRPAGDPAYFELFCEDVDEIPKLVHACFDPKTATDADAKHQYDEQVFNRYTFLQQLLPAPANTATLSDFCKLYNQQKPAGDPISYPSIDLTAGG